MMTCECAALLVEERADTVSYVILYKHLLSIATRRPTTEVPLYFVKVLLCSAALANISEDKICGTNTSAFCGGEANKLYSLTKFFTD